MPSLTLTLVIGNKNYSSWSLRAWLAMTEAGIAFAERLVKFDSEDWAANIASLSPTRLVPVLWEGEPGEGFATFDTLAILERLHELHPDAAIWPADSAARARARSLAADFHAGYHALRNAMPMNIRSHHPGKGMTPEVYATTSTAWRPLGAQRASSSGTAAHSCSAPTRRRTPISRPWSRVSQLTPWSWTRTPGPISRPCWQRRA